MTYLEIALRTKILVGFIGLVFIGYIIWLLYKKRLSESFALGWIFVTVLAVSNVLFDIVLEYVVHFSGIKTGATAIAMFAFVFIFAMLIIFSIKISTLAAQNKKLAQYIGLLEARLDEAEEAKP